MPLAETVRLGDLVVWLDAGAYHLPWETRFSHGLCAVVWVDEAERCRSLVPRETPQQWADVWSRVPMTAPAPVVEAPGNFCRFDQGRLSRPFDAEPPSTLTRFVHDAFRALVLNERFSCIGGRVAVKRGAYRFALYDRIGSSDAAAGLALDLSRFAADADLMAEPLTAFVASFIEPAPPQRGQASSTLLWSTLQQVNDRDGSALGAMIVVPTLRARNFRSASRGTATSSSASMPAVPGWHGASRGRRSCSIRTASSTV